MRGFQPVAGAGEAWEAVLEPEEGRILLSLAEQLQALLSGALSAAADDDTAVRRLLPDAYRHDPELAEEWRRLSRRGLVDRKIGFARTIAAALGPVAEASSAQPLRLTPADALDWVRGIGDLRLVIADRLGIIVDGDDGEFGEPGLRDLYDWLAWVQDDLVRVLDAPPLDAPRDAS